MNFRGIILLLLIPVFVVIPKGLAGDTLPQRFSGTNPARSANPLVGFAKDLLGPDGGNRLFYLPTRDEPATPSDWGCRYEEIRFHSGDRTMLNGWFVRPGLKSPLGTVVFSHGNAGSMGYHLGFAMWMVQAGYQVFMYDYRGFGKSQGDLSRGGMIEDARAALTLAAARNDVRGLPLFSYGHSMGGAKSIAALACISVPGLKGVVVDGSFSSYQAMARLVGGEVGGSVVTDEFAPKDLVRKISPVPLLVIHGTRDEVVPFSQGKELFDRALEPKTLFAVENGRHGDSLVMRDGFYRKRMLSWFSAR